MTDSTDTGAPVLTLAGVMRHFGGAPVLDEISFEVASGECVVVLGPNGAGKTTMLRVAAGRLDPTGGGVLVDGASPHDPLQASEARRALSFVPDTPLLYDHLTVGEHVELVHAAHAPQHEDPALAALLTPAEALAKLEITALAARLPTSLSRGQRQRVQLACAVCRPVRVLLLDEPVVGLDPRSQRILAELITWLMGRGVALVVSTHQLGFARAVGTRALVLESGRLVFSGSVDGAAEVTTDLVPW